MNDLLKNSEYNSWLKALKKKQLGNSLLLNIEDIENKLSGDNEKEVYS